MTPNFASGKTNHLSTSSNQFYRQQTHKVSVIGEHFPCIQVIVIMLILLRVEGDSEEWRTVFWAVRRYVTIFVKSSSNGSATLSCLTIHRWWRTLHSTSCCVYWGCHKGKENYFLLFLWFKSIKFLSLFSIYIIWWQFKKYPMNAWQPDVVVVEIMMITWCSV